MLFRLYCLLVAIAIIVHPVFAQKQDNNWCLGTDFGINFNTNPPTVFTGIKLYTGANATVSNPLTGELFFYTNGINVWDRSHNIMPNGNGIGITNTNSMQGALIAGDPSNADRYFVFAMEGGGTSPKSLYYSIVDMTLNGGMGDVVTGKKKILIDDGFGEMMTIVPGNNCDMWLVTMRASVDTFRSYNISSNGSINTSPVVSTTTTGLPKYRYIGGIKISPDRKKMAATFRIQTFNTGILVLYDFDAATGVISNSMVIPGAIQSITQGCEFSTNSRYLYGSFSNGVDGRNTYFEISRLDVSLPTATDIDNSIKPIALNKRGNAFQMGSDKCIYVAESGGTISKISNVDAAVPDYTPAVIKLKPQDVEIFSLPQKVHITNYKVDLGRDTSICANEPFVLNLNIPGATYLWQDGSTGNRMVVKKTGKYYVTTNVYGCVKSDTVDIIVHPEIFFSLGADTSLCPGAYHTLSVADTFDSYQWSTGNNTNNITISEPGMYWLKLTNNGCSNTDTIKINYYSPSINLGPDTIMCIDDTLILNVTSIEGSKYLWQDGSTNDQFTVYAEGKYWVTITNKCGIYNDTISAQFEKCECKPSIPNAFTPNNDGLNDKFGPVLNCKTYQYKFIVVNRFGEAVFKSTSPGEKWNGIYKGQPAEIGTYYFLVEITGPLKKPYFFKGDVLLLR